MAITTIAALATPNAVAEGATTRFTTTGHSGFMVIILTLMIKFFFIA